MKNQKPTTPNILTEEWKAPITLKRDQPIHVIKADKGNVTIVLNRSDYERKVSEHLTNKSYEVIQGKERKLNAWQNKISDMQIFV